MEDRMPLTDPQNEISAYAFVHPNVIMGKGNIVMEGAIIREGVVIGNNNYIGPYCIIGDIPEKIGYWDRPAGVIICDNNRFTKQVTIDSGTEKKTLICNGVIMLKNSHVGHDAIIHDGVILSCNSIIGGHTTVGEKTNFGLGAVSHQRLNIPEGCMIGMNSTITKKTIMTPNRKFAGSPAKDIGSNIREQPETEQTIFWKLCENCQATNHGLNSVCDECGSKDLKILDECAE